ncbi:conserved phage C-terminal domain-containing protein [candidate division KSB1 bacterium]|nr:conserved phage C-terminal domain-containing protein [candidate division KSB1 bacterium]
MKLGNWIPISKGFLFFLPRDRPYTKLEAAFSLQIDYDQGNKVTVTGYSQLWRWSVGKVYRFLREMGVQIKYDFDTKKKQNQNGMIVNMITERKRNESGMIRLIDNKDLEGQTERKRNESGMKTDQRRVTTKDPNPDKGNIPFLKIISDLNQRANTRFSHETKSTRRLIGARFNEGRTFNDFQAVHMVKCAQWLNDDKMVKYLRPETLYSAKHFESYLNEAKRNGSGPAEQAEIKPDPLDPLRQGYDILTTKGESAFKEFCRKHKNHLTENDIDAIKRKARGGFDTKVLVGGIG